MVETNINIDPSDKHKEVMIAEEVLDNKPGASKIASDQVTNKDVHNRSNNVFIFGHSTPKIVNIRNLKINYSIFIGGVNKTYKNGCPKYNFHFTDDLNVKKEYIWKENLQLNCSGKDLLMSNFLEDLINNLTHLFTMHPFSTP